MILRFFLGQLGWKARGLTVNLAHVRTIEIADIVSFKLPKLLFCFFGEGRKNIYVFITISKNMRCDYVDR
jgi:hypothetical protein